MTILRTSPTGQQVCLTYIPAAGLRQLPLWEVRIDDKWAGEYNALMFNSASVLRFFGISDPEVVTTPRGWAVAEA